MKIRSEDFWETFESNCFLLDWALRKFKDGKEIVQVSALLIRPIRDGEVLAVEFLHHLIDFCQKIVEWFDVPRLSPLDTPSIVSLRRILRTVKSTMERYKHEILQQNYIDVDPVEFYEIHLSLIKNIYQEFMKNVELHVASIQPTPAQSTSSTTPTTNTNTATSRQIKVNQNDKRKRKRKLGIDVHSSEQEDDVKVKQFLTGLESDTSEDESDESEPTRFVAEEEEEDKKPVSDQISTYSVKLGSSSATWSSGQPTEPILTSLTNQCEHNRNDNPTVEETKPDLRQVGLNLADQNLEVIDRSINRSTISPFNNIGSSPDIKPVVPTDDQEEPPRLPLNAPQVKLENQEDEHEETSDLHSVDHIKRSLVHSHALDSRISCDLWITHLLLHLFEPFKLPNYFTKLQFNLEKIAHFTFPRFQHQVTSPSPEDEHKSLPIELVILVNIHFKNRQDITEFQNSFGFFFNENPITIRNFGQAGSFIKFVLPIHPDYLKEGRNEILVKKKSERGEDESESEEEKDWQEAVQLSIEEVTMLSEREMFEKAIQSTCPARRTVQLFNANHGQIPLLDPVHHSLILCPVRGADCNHFSCFDLQKFIHRNKFLSSWKCPIERCDKICKPFQLEFDDWLYRNIKSHINQNLINQ